MKNVSTGFGLCVAAAAALAYPFVSGLAPSANASAVTAAAAAVSTAATASASAVAQVSWADWTIASAGTPGWAEGTLRGVEVRYSGEVLFAATDDASTNYWAPSDAYVSPLVPNPPRSSDIIAIVGGNQVVNTLTFSEPVTDVVIGIVSLGSADYVVDYVFGSDFTILSNGTGYWGSGPLSQPASNILRGSEGHGVIVFPGPVMSISWTVPAGEYWHGFTIGALPAPCKGDINGDRAVNGEDLGALLIAWGPCSSIGCAADLNGGGVVDGGDLGMLLSAWGACP